MTSVYGLAQSLASLSNLGECWAIFDGWDLTEEYRCRDGYGRDRGLFDGGLFIANTDVYGSILDLQALPNLGEGWDIFLTGSYSSCTAYSGFFTECDGQRLISDARIMAGRDACACCASTSACRDWRTGSCTVPLDGVCPPLPNCVGAWRNWTDCSATCESSVSDPWEEFKPGVQDRSYQIVTAAYAGGDACPLAEGASETQDCNLDPCEVPFAIDCSGRWSICSPNCEGWNLRRWTQTASRAGVGTACPTPRSCQPGEDFCPDDIDCTGDWSWCSEECEPALLRSWTLVEPQSGNGDTCPLPTTCQAGEGGCPADLDCLGFWSNCTDMCEPAIDRNWTSIQNQSGLGDYCPQSRSCKPGMDECPIDMDCQGNWSSCTALCEPAMHRSWTETQAQSGYGDACPMPTTCQAGEDQCPWNATIMHYDCIGEWSPCTERCERASARSFNKIQATLGLGAPCPAVINCRPGDGGCPRHTDCEGAWSNCTARCEPADNRTWIETVAPAGRGSPCPISRKCRQGDGQCPRNIDCSGAWSNCSADCEPAENRSFTQAAPQSGLGAPCPVSWNCRPDEQGCPPNIDCIGFWSFCSTECEKGPNRTWTEQQAQSVRFEALFV